MILKKEFVDFIMKGPTEQEIAEYIKKDMSFIAEAYAFPKDEFICISEYPIDDGYVDYLIMSGRSRMKINLVEIKGADFNLINKDNTVNKKISDAIQQINRRAAYIDKNYEYFRKRVHNHREEAENNKLNFKYVRGGRGDLYVDKDKEIVVSSLAVIGGRMTNDSLESKVRDEFERQTNFRTKVDSWDSFIRRVQRD